MWSEGYAHDLTMIKCHLFFFELYMDILSSFRERKNSLKFHPLSQIHIFQRMKVWEISFVFCCKSFDLIDRTLPSVCGLQFRLTILLCFSNQIGTSFSCSLIFRVEFLIWFDFNKKPILFWSVYVFSFSPTLHKTPKFMYCVLHLIICVCFPSKRCKAPCFMVHILDFAWSDLWLWIKMMAELQGFWDRIK